MEESPRTLVKLYINDMYENKISSFFLYIPQPPASAVRLRLLADYEGYTAKAHNVRW